MKAVKGGLCLVTLKNQTLMYTMSVYLSFLFPIMYTHTHTHTTRARALTHTFCVCGDGEREKCIGVGMIVKYEV